MPVGPDTAHKKVNAAATAYLLLISTAFGIKVGSVAVENVHILRQNVYMVEEIAVRETVVALRMILRQSHILIHIERNHIAETHTPFPAGFGRTGIVPNGDEPVGSPSTNGLSGDAP